MDEPMTLTPIGRVESPVRDIVDDAWGGRAMAIHLDPARFGPEALAGLADFSHVEVVFHFDRVAEAEVQTSARHPRGRMDWPKVGIFAQRARLRPNRLGVTVCRLLAVEGLTVRVEALDAVDGTPVVDLKPVMREFLPRGEVRQPAWATELMASYWREPSV